MYFKKKSGAKMTPDEKMSKNYTTQ